jgi:radical SAM protein with 4Fe4S-binding SPASM domain
MIEPYASYESLPKAEITRKLKERRLLLDFSLDITARCNNNCRHCYINLPANDEGARAKELTLAEIDSIADQAMVLGGVWCLIGGGEPLLRQDFADIYMLLKRKGLLVSLFTNACLVTDEYADMLRKYPPRDIEVTVYGVTERTYEAVTRKPGSYAAFKGGLKRLLDRGVKVRLKTMATRSSLHELPEIARFCREHTKDYFRFDPWLHYRYDMDEHRNLEIEQERLTPEEFVAAERGDAERYNALNSCSKDMLIHDLNGSRLFICGTGVSRCNIGYDGTYRLCGSLWHPDCIYDLRQGSLEEAFLDWVPKVLDMRAKHPEFADRCGSCKLFNFCLWCPAHAHLETGELDLPVEYFCKIAHARAEELGIPV